jgi:hypothetical protein
MATRNEPAPPPEVVVGGRRRPLPETPEDRIRKVFQLPPDTALPAVTEATLRQYHEYLLANLAFPFEALFCRDDVASRQLIQYIRVVGLTEDVRIRCDNRHGVLCKAHHRDRSIELPLAELGVREENPNCQLIDDYAYWFVNSH